LKGEMSISTVVKSIYKIHQIHGTVEVKVLAEAC